MALIAGKGRATGAPGARPELRELAARLGALTCGTALSPSLQGEGYFQLRGRLRHGHSGRPHR